MNVIAWLMLVNIIMMCINLWVLHDALYISNLLEELHTKNWGRFSELLNRLSELKEKHESTTRK
jgi:hypothetical protein